MSLYDISKMYGVDTKTLNSSAALTDHVLVQASGGKRIVVDFFEISSDGIMTAVLESGTSNQISCKEYMAANSGKVLDTPFIATNVGEDLTLTTTIATTANYSLMVKFHYE